MCTNSFTADIKLVHDMLRWFKLLTLSKKKKKSNIWEGICYRSKIFLYIRWLICKYFVIVLLYINSDTTNSFYGKPGDLECKVQDSLHIMYRNILHFEIPKTLKKLWFPNKPQYFPDSSCSGPTKNNLWRVLHPQPPPTWWCPWT